MKRTFFLIFLSYAILASRAVPAARGDYYRTSVGAVFERVTFAGFGESWRAPDGRVWSDFQGEFTNDGADENFLVIDSAAVDACKNIGGHLPTRGEFEGLKVFFEVDEDELLTPQGRRDLLTLFPEMRNQLLWTASISRYRSYYAYMFIVTFGDTGFHRLRSSALPVICVGS